MRQKIGFLKKATAKIDGYYSHKGERLVSARLTPEEVAAFNGEGKKKAAAKAPKQPKAKVVEAAPVVEVVAEQEPVAEAVVVVEEVAAPAEEQKAE